MNLSVALMTCWLGKPEDVALPVPAHWEDASHVPVDAQIDSPEGHEV